LCCFALNRIKLSSVKLSLAWFGLIPSWCVMLRFIVLRALRPLAN